MARHTRSAASTTGDVQHDDEPVVSVSPLVDDLLSDDASQHLAERSRRVRSVLQQRDAVGAGWGIAAAGVAGVGVVVYLANLVLAMVRSDPQATATRLCWSWML
ncbi:MAG: hypothetical protein INR72_13665, partial [Williamsia herbipolensis]|nr:hypothetical protein [Williamsia herbipolensis]